MKRGRRNSVPPTQNLFSFFSSVSSCPEIKKNKPEIKDTNCHTSSPINDPSDDFVLLGPAGLVEVSNQSPCIPLHSTTESSLLPKIRSNRRRRWSAPPSFSDPQTIYPAVFSTTPSCINNPSYLNTHCKQSTDCTLTYNHEDLLKHMYEQAKAYFGIETLNQFQVAAIEACFQKKDVFVVVSTGGGKSLCYQLPPLMPEAINKFALIVSPLISLMEDQVLYLMQKKIPAMTFSGAKKNAWTDIKLGRYRLVYCSPEFIQLHLDKLSQYFAGQVLLIAIDECHCVSEWGHHFRPSYRKLARLRIHFPHVPIMCLTATATAGVRSDIIRVFKLSPSRTLHLRGTINRQNIFYRVLQRSSSIHKDLAPFLNISESLSAQSVMQRPPIDNSCIGPYASTLIYVATKNDAESLATLLQVAGVSTAAYHAGLSASKRSEVHHQFLADSVQVVCATIAFGMGIDKPDVRRIIHWCLPSSMEAYAQQSGRAGRDRLPSEAVLLWAPKDLTRTKNIILLPSESGPTSEVYKQRLLDLFNTVVDYVQLENTCRREFIMKYFGDSLPNCSNESGDSTKETPVIQGICRRVPIDAGDITKSIIKCDFCDQCCYSYDRLARPNAEHHSDTTDMQYPAIDLTEEAQVILRCILACKERTGASLPCKVAIGSRSKDVLAKRLDQVPVFGKGSTKPLYWWKELLLLLRRANYTEEKLSGIPGAKGKPQYLAVRLTPKGRQFLSTETPPRFEITKPTKTMLLALKKASSVKKEQTSPHSDLNLTVSSIDTIVKGENILRQKLMQIRFHEARRRQCAPFMVLPMPSIENVIKIRPSTIDILLNCTAQVPANSSTEFLQSLIDAVISISKQYGLGTDYQLDKPSVFPTDVVEEELPTIQDNDSMSSDNDDGFFLRDSLSIQSPNGQMSQQTLLDLSPIDATEFDEVLPNILESFSPSTRTQSNNAPHDFNAPLA